MSAPEPGRGTGALLSFLAGYADTVGFVGLGGLFTAHVTGNFVLLGYALVGPVQGIVPKLLAFPVFVLGIAATRLLVARWQRQGRPALRLAMLAQAVLLAASGACAWLNGPVTAPDAPLALACGMLCVAAMAAQNAYGKLLLAQLPATTVMTGNWSLPLPMPAAATGRLPPARCWPGCWALPPAPAAAPCWGTGRCRWPCGQRACRCCGWHVRQAGRQRLPTPPEGVFSFTQHRNPPVYLSSSLCSNITFPLQVQIKTDYSQVCRSM